jgi:hypothetical protein
LEQSFVCHSFIFRYLLPTPIAAVVPTGKSRDETDHNLNEYEGKTCSARLKRLSLPGVNYSH